MPVTVVLPLPIYTRTLSFTLVKDGVDKYEITEYEGC